MNELVYILFGAAGAIVALAIAWLTRDGDRASTPDAKPSHRLPPPEPPLSPFPEPEEYLEPQDTYETPHAPNDDASLAHELEWLDSRASALEGSDAVDVPPMRGTPRKD